MKKATKDSSPNTISNILSSTNIYILDYADC